jgi:DNA-binding LacI/PurR family transcriptional regulator
VNSQKITINRGRVNLVDQLTQILRRKIVTGEYLPGNVLPSLEDLKQETGLHRNTVKQAFSKLRESGLVKYQPTVGCIVRDDALMRICLMLPVDFDNPLAVLNGMNDALASCGETTLMLYRDTDDFQSRLKQLDAFTGAAIYPDHNAREQVARLRESGFPVVVIDNFHDNPAHGCFVDSGPYAAACDLTERLFEQRCDPVAIITPDDLFGRKLATGCRDVYAKHRTRMFADHWSQTRQDNPASEVTANMLSRGNPPKAIIYANPHDAMLGCRVIKEKGKTHVKVACFGEMPGMDLWSHPVMTVKRDYRRIGTDAARLLLELRQLPKSQRLALRMAKHRE